MVTINPLADGASSPQSVAASDRNLVHEHEFVASPMLTGRTQLAWGAVIAGAIAAISLLVLSSSLAYACGVPGYSGGAYGWGSGIWAVVTAIIAYFIGGAVVSYLSPVSELRTGAVHGFLGWALSLPLLLLLSTTAVGFARTLIASDALRMTVQPAMNEPTHASLTGAAWGSFIALACGLIFAILGGVYAFGAKSTRMTTR
ncbi:MAG TPA: hypothetical protein VHQ47_15040 [Phycisphaerae bacterium]|jgi:hypothetical protein|nr:hypothetical protein [Phycisphaerae bacterium]